MVENVLKDDYLDLVREVQDAMMRKMARMGVVVECNPSSNCVIGSFRDYAQHPIFRMLAIRSDGESGERLVVTVNTDDIGVFDTALQNEYVLLAAAMLDRGKSAEGSLDIGLRQLEELRRNGFLASFSEQIRMSYSNGFRSLYD
jgi:adenosine deaminase